MIEKKRKKIKGVVIIEPSYDFTNGIVTNCTIKAMFSKPIHHKEIDKILEQAMMDDDKWD